MRRTLALIVVSIAFAGCGSSAGPAATPPVVWHDGATRHYEFDYTTSCFCPQGTWHIEVDHGRVVRSDPLGRIPGNPIPQRVTIDSLLTELARAKKEATGLVAATLDPATGVPTKVSIDWVKNAIDDEYAWTVTNFHSLPEG